MYGKQPRSVSLENIEIELFRETWSGESLLHAMVKIQTAFHDIGKIVSVVEKDYARMIGEGIRELVEDYRQMNYQMKISEAVPESAVPELYRKANQKIIDIVKKYNMEKTRELLDAHFKEEMSRRFGPRTEVKGDILNMRKPFAFPSPTFYHPAINAVVELGHEDDSVLVYVSEKLTQRPMEGVRVWCMYSDAPGAQEIKTDEYGKAELLVPSYALESLAVEVGGKTLEEIIKESEEKK